MKSFTMLNAKNKSRKLENQVGQSLVQTLVAIGIMIVLMGGFASMLSNQQRETRSLSEVLGSMDLQKTLTATLADGSVCRYILNNPSVLTFDSTLVSPSTPQTMTPTLPIYASVTSGPPVVTGPITAQVGQQASAFSNTLVVNGIVLSITGAPTPMPAPGPGATFTGNWIVSFDSSKMIRSVKPVSVSTILTVDTTQPTLAKITNCMSGMAGSGGGRTSCPTGYALVGTSGDHGAYCISTSTMAAQTWLNAAGSCYSQNPKALLCSTNQWVTACNAGMLTGLGSYEWLGEMSAATGNAACAGQSPNPCAHFGGYSPTSSFSYRCCLN